MAFLLQDKGLGREPIPVGSPSETYHSNCHGTIMFLLGRAYPESPERNAFRNLLQVPAEGRPGYFDGVLMEPVLREFDCIGINDFDCRDQSLFGIFNLQGQLGHTGLYLGDVDNKKVVFHQPNCGRAFCVASFQRTLADYDILPARKKEEIARKSYNILQVW